MLSILIIVLVLVIAVMQAVYGLFNSLIMALCTLVCTVLAFNYYEAVVAAMNLYEHQPAYAEPVALMLLLVGPLLLLRFLVDSYLPGNVVADVWVDRVCGFGFGLVTAMLLVGTLGVAMQMLPFDRAVLGYDPYDDNLQESGSLILDAPAFTLGTVKKLSGGAFAGKAGFGDVHDDLTLELWGRRNRLTGARIDSPAKAFKVNSVHDVTNLPYPGKGGGESDTFGVHAPAYPGVQRDQSRVVIARVTVSSDAADSDAWYRVKGTQLRLITKDGRGVFPVAYLVNMGQWQVFDEPIGELQINRPASGKNRMLTMDLMYRVPVSEGAAAVELASVVFRGSASAKTPKLVADMPDDEGALALKEVYGRVAVKGPGTKALFRPTEAMLNVGLPIPFGRKGDARDKAQVKMQADGDAVEGSVDGQRFLSGRIKGSRDGLMDISGARAREMILVNSLGEPSGKKIVKLVGKPLVSDLFSGLVGQTLAQPEVILANGSSLGAVGAYVTWSDGDGRNMHLFYNPNPDEFAEFIRRPEEGVGDVIKTYRQKRKATGEFCLIFAVPDDATITGFRVTGNERYYCESPLSVKAKPRVRRRRKK